MKQFIETIHLVLVFYAAIKKYDTSILLEQLIPGQDAIIKVKWKNISVGVQLVRKDKFWNGETAWELGTNSTVSICI